jgi:multiple sugar transport system substrate-binding protein
MRQARVIGTTLCLLAILLTSTLSCGTTLPEETPPPSPGPTATITVPVEMPVTIALTGSFSDEVLDYLDRQISIFEARNPDIRVAILSAPRRDDRRRVAFSEQLGQGDRSADIYAVDPAWLAELGAQGGLASLDEHMAKHAIQMEVFFAPAGEASSLGGRTFALPWSIDGGLLYYRRDLLRDYGYEPPLDWPTLEQAALEIKTGEGLPAGFVWQGAPYESLTCNTLEYIWAYGGRVLDIDGNPIFDSAGTRAGLQQMVNLIEIGATPPEVAGYMEFDARTAFEDGEAAMMRHWASLWPRLDGSASHLSEQVGLQLSLSAYSLNPEQAFRFMAFLVSPAQQIQLALQGGQLPALDAAYQDAEVLGQRPEFRDLRDALSTARTRPTSPAYAQISEAIYTEVNAMLLGTQDVATTAARIQRRLETAIR